MGATVKVWLPGETPWAEVVAVNPGGTFYGRIDNELVGSMTEDERRKLSAKMFPGSDDVLPSLHDYRYNDCVRFKWDDDGTGARWMPVREDPARAQ